MSKRRNAGALAPYRVVDLTQGPAELATAILAGLGADVIKVEPPGGARSRHDRGQRAAEQPGLPGSHFHAYNRGKRSVIIDLTDGAGRCDLLDLVATADFVFEDAGPGVLDGLGLGFEALRQVRPDLVHVALSPFGQDGPYAKHLATDLTLSAMGGAMALNGEPDRRPVRITTPQTWYHGAAESVVGALVAHHRRVATGEAQFVDLSVQAAVFWTGLNAMVAHAIQGRDIERKGTVMQVSTLTTPLCYPCQDGDVVLIATSTTLIKLVPWMVESGAVTAEWAAQEDWAKYEAHMLTGEALAVSHEEVRERIAVFTRMHPKLTLFEGGIARGVTIAPVNTVADVLNMEHLLARDYWDDIVTSDAGTLRAPGAFVKASGTPVVWPPQAPALGQHTDDVLGPLKRASAVTAPRAAEPTRARLPLEGLKVADFSWIGAGPITAKALADHGATVVHVESDAPADRLRLVGPFKDDVPGVDRCQFFGSFNTSKLSLQLNLKHPEGQEVAKQLLAWCDVALDSFAAGTMAKLGLGYDVAREVNPSIIMATTNLMGQTGPAARLAGYGYHAAAVSGFYEITGWDDRPPAGPYFAYTDTIAPRFLAPAILAALDHRRRTGQGQFIEQAQIESALHFLAPELLDVQVSGVSARRNGNDDPNCSPHDAYPCAGIDEWCAIAVETDAQWLNLRRVLGEPAWAMDAALESLTGRRAAREVVDRELSAFTSRYEPRALMLLLQAADVPAGMVQRSSDHLDDPQLAHRAFFRRLQHPAMGEVPYEGHQFRISGYDNGPRFPAPCLGEHTFEVLHDVLDFDMDEVTRILATGACG